jgi:hypothetical protein
VQRKKLDAAAAGKVSVSLLEGGGGNAKTGIGRTGVHFRYYKPEEFNALSHAQRKELLKHRESTGGGTGGLGKARKKRGGSGGGSGGGGGREGSAGRGGGSQTAKNKNKRKQIAAAQVSAIADQLVERLSRPEVTPGINGGEDAKRYIMALLNQDEGTPVVRAKRTKISSIAASVKVGDSAPVVA